ncbi:hypothetical protein FACS1894178_7020 [Bacteroidia bacterium]|nr:hypothetical protein FACS1894178_7020 [Bacteroidia bacterium]
MRKQLLIFILLLTATLTFVQAQHEYQVVAGSGMSYMQYTLNGKNSFGWGGNAGFAMNIMFHKYVGINFGVETACYNSKIKATGVEMQYNGWLDDYLGEVNENYRYNLTTQLPEYSEKQHQQILQIPVALYLQTNTTGYARLYAMLGLKFIVPLLSKYSVADATVDNYAYYPELDNTAYEGMYNHFSGFGHFDDKSFEDDLKLNVGVMGTVEIGSKFHIGNKIALYCGIYADYGLNDIRKKERTDFIAHEDGKLIGGDFEPNSLIMSKNGDGSDLVKHLLPFSAGIKLRFAFSNVSYNGKIFMGKPTVNGFPYTVKSNRIRYSGTVKVGKKQSLHYKDGKIVIKKNDASDEKPIEKIEKTAPNTLEE